MNSNGSRPEDGEQLLHKGVLFFLQLLAGLMGGRKPSVYCPLRHVMSLSLHHAQAQDLYEEKRSHESLAEKRRKTRVKLELECAAGWRGGGRYG